MNLRRRLSLTGHTLMRSLLGGATVRRNPYAAIIRSLVEANRAMGMDVTPEAAEANLEAQLREEPKSA